MKSNNTPKSTYEKFTVLIIALLTFNLAHAQKKIENLEEITASNGVTYRVGDEIKLGRGSDTDGRFVYVKIGGWAISSNPEANRLPASNAGLIVTIKKIQRYNYKRYKGLHLIVGGGNITNYTIDLENAIQTCELEDCKKEVAKLTDKYDALKKLKDLLDDGAITQEEYDREKEKILQ